MVVRRQVEKSGRKTGCEIPIEVVLECPQPRRCSEAVEDLKSSIVR